MRCGMKYVPSILAAAAAILIAATWLEAVAEHRGALLGSALALAVAAAIFAAVAPSRTPVRPAPISPAPAAAGSPPGPGLGHSRDADIVSFLSLLQENGRFVDFLMDDITAYPDAQIGAAARIVHQGCRGVLEKHFAISPACESAEGTVISVPASYRGDEYRLSGRITGEPPFTGRVVHRGWKTAAVKLPRVSAPDGEIPNIAPTEVEIS